MTVSRANLRDRLQARRTSAGYIGRIISLVLPPVDAACVAQEPLHAVPSRRRQRHRATVRMGLDLRVGDEMRGPTLPDARRRPGQGDEAGLRNLLSLRLGDEQMEQDVPGVLVEDLAGEDVGPQAAHAEEVFGSLSRVVVVVAVTFHHEDYATVARTPYSSSERRRVTDVDTGYIT
jgi:hypothetical protein